MRGVHIVWESSNEIYYVRLNEATQDFRDGKRVTDLSPGTGLRPKVVTSANKAHVSFVRTDVNPDSAATRDASFSTNGGISWEGSYENIATPQRVLYDIRYQSLVRRGDTWSSPLA
ncbi:MAG TPA: hypothetical protein DGH68_07865 [Bacteroidetes bacterium]|nr:hypothetical protein [Bacteroidota bacterium]